MSNAPKTLIFLVDDDALYLKDLEIALLQHHDFDIETFATGERCLAELARRPDVVILDYHLDGIEPGAMDGIRTLDKIKDYNASIAVIVLSSQDKIDVAVNCMHHNAFDYIVKSETAHLRLNKSIKLWLRLQKMEKVLNWYMDRA